MTQVRQGTHVHHLTGLQIGVYIAALASADSWLDYDFVGETLQDVKLAIGLRLFSAPPTYPWEDKILEYA